MKRNSLLLATALLIGMTGCKNTPVQKEAWISNRRGTLRNKQVPTFHTFRL